MSYTAAGAAIALDDFTDRTLYLGLSTTDPASSVTEPSGNNYSRATVAAADWAAASAASPATITTTAAVSMPVPSGSWGTCTHFVLYSAATGGVLYRYGALDSSITPDAASTSVSVTPTLRQSL